MDKHSSIRRHAARLAGVAALLAGLAGCNSMGVGIGIPVGPLSVGVGMGSGGPSLGVGTGWGPLGVGVGVQSGGQVTGHAGVGVSAPVGAASVGVGVGRSTVLHDPNANSNAPVQPVPEAAPAPGAVRQWQDAQGRVVPECQTRGGCGPR
ncbi:hypothetical protein N0K08_07520 [Acidovorax sp. Be4]|uniref:Lipoprotein n=1 Tax=Acidovorax bellezanensis TaxID=2976702 RepID=A0ABT2PJ24_9BURK|nr:hypothetical protein [Acidovorax sp. Be4]MCT9810476.1 hypothetical protein [Acidovorax sp. Be4]